MNFLEFKINNFKGINDVVLDLNKIPRLNIFTLVGLNESGKTTILEAVNTFLKAPQDPDNIIPKSKRANFNDEIVIETTFALDTLDENKLQTFLKGKFELTQPVNTFRLKNVIRYENSTFKETKQLWTISLIGKTKRSKVEKNLLNVDRDLWSQAIHFIKENLIPTVVYYPNFLFNFPTSIYLEPYQNEGKEQEFYRSVLQDVLDSLNQKLDLKTHLLERKKVGGKSNEESIEKVLSEMAGKISKDVFEAWGRVSGIGVSKKTVTLGNDIKSEVGEGGTRYYVEIKIKEGTDTYFINERSLGFRWFFAFLLFTQFRKHRSSETKNMLFLLDEPASNLHQTGQQELLASLEKLTEGSTVIYSTHSHHLVNPKWLAGAFIIRNKGLNPDIKALQDDFNATKTNIKVERYFNFVSKYPKEETHYKPILDVLDYKPGKLENIPDVIVSEGKFDFYTLHYFERELYKHNDMHIYPGAGKDKQGPVIALYMAWGRNFIVLLDSDKGGIKSKEAYIEEFGDVVKDRIFTLENVDASFKNAALEDLILEQDRVPFIQTVFPNENKYDKSKFNSAIQHNLINDISFKFSKQTLTNFKKVIEFLNKKVSDGKSKKF